MSEQLYIINGVEGNFTSPTDPNDPFGAASSFAATLAYANADAHRAHLQAVGLGVGLGLCLPLVVLASAVGAVLLYRRRIQKGRSEQSPNVEATSDAIHGGIGTERASPAKSPISGFGTKTETNGT